VNAARDGWISNISKAKTVYPSFSCKVCSPKRSNTQKRSDRTESAEIWLLNLENFEDKDFLSSSMTDRAQTEVLSSSEGLFKGQRYGSSEIDVWNKASNTKNGNNDAFNISEDILPELSQRDICNNRT
jgi:hypothetical protein